MERICTVVLGIVGRICMDKILVVMMFLCQYSVIQKGKPSVNRFDIFWHKPGDACAVEFFSLLYKVFPGV